MACNSHQSRCNHRPRTHGHSGYRHGTARPLARTHAPSVGSDRVGCCRCNYTTDDTAQLGHVPQCLGQTSSEDRVVSTINPVLLSENALRNLLNNVDTLRYSINTHIVHFEATLGRWLHLDHPSTSTSVPFGAARPQWPYQLSTPTEDGSGSLVALVALLFAAIALMRRNLRERTSIGVKPFLAFHKAPPTWMTAPSLAVVASL